MNKIHQFKSFRVKKGIYDLSPNAPDYDGIIQLNKRYFTLTGWLGELNSDISFKLQEITEERLKDDKYLRSKYLAFINDSR